MKKILLFLSFFLLLKIDVLAYKSAKSTIVMDVDSGRVLYQKDSNSERLIASITKIMTCIVVLENSNLDDIVKVGEEVLKMYGTNIYIEVGEEMSVKDLLYGMMLRSGNDAALVLAIHTSGSEEAFVNLMNKKAKEIGMNNTTFNNPHGLDEETKNISTAYDMALLSRYAYKNKKYREIISTKKYTTKSNLKSYTWYNRMSLLNKYSKCIGGKNGYTPRAGKTLVSLAKQDNFTITIVTLDDDNIYSNHERLYEEMFKKYKNYIIIDKNNYNINNPFIKKNLYIKKSFTYPLEEKELDYINSYLRIYNINKDNEVGSISVRLNNKEIGSILVYQKKKLKTS